MKQLLFFLLIVTVCGSLSKAPVIIPCGREIKIEYYKNRKSLKREIVDGYAIANRTYGVSMWGAPPGTDSVDISVYIPSRK